jgi:hypothetical protein
MPPSPVATTDWADESPTSQNAYLSLARRLRKLGHPILGLWPVSVSDSSTSICRNLAVALASLGGTVGLLVPKEEWAGGTAQGQLLVSNLADAVDSLTPAQQGRLSPASVVDQILGLVRERYSILLLDLSGMGLPDVHEIALLPEVGIVFLVAQGQTNELALARLRRRIPSERLLGAVLVEPLPELGA